jgi:hypothetical protein
MAERVHHSARPKNKLPTTNSGVLQKVNFNGYGGMVKEKNH